MSEEKISSKLVVKSGLWYTISNFAFKAFSFLSAPIFARMLSKAEFGEYNNLFSWMQILIIFVGLDISSSVIRAKLDFEDDLDRYALSVLTLTTINALILFFVFRVFEQPFLNLIGVKREHLDIVFVYMLFIQAVYIFSTLERARYRYKAFSLITGIGVIGSNGLSILLILIMSEKLNARVIGYFVPYIILGMVLYILLIKKGKTIKFHYYRYALTLSIPLIPHLLSLTILSASDRVMITKMVGAESTAIYSVAYLFISIIIILLDSMNKAWAPWLLDSLKAKDFRTIRKVTSPYFLIFFGLILGSLLIGPEIILILGGERYLEAKYSLPPLVIGTLFQFAYLMYVQLEYYEKKLRMISVATITAATLNIVLNLLLIPIFGYIVASYTTLIGYIVLFIFHYKTIARYGYKDLFDRKVIFTILISSLVLIPIFIFLYKNDIIRYIVLVLYFIFLIKVFLQYKDKIKEFLKNK